MSLASPSDRRVDHFRGEHPSLPLHPVEKALLTLLSLHLCFLPWALGAMHPWSQLTSLSLSLLTFTLSLLPRTYSGDYALPINRVAAPIRGLITNNPQPITLVPWPRLLRFPIFWLGLALLGCIGLQASNPSWTFARNATQWWLVRVNDIPWLPTSIDVPWERFNVWRQFIIYASAWLTVCAAWTGLTRRRSLQILLIVLVVNGAALAIFGLMRHTLGLESYFGFKWPGDAVGFASFIYKNHGGAYLALMTFTAAALAVWFHDHGERQLKKSTPAALLAFGSIVLGVTVAFTLSRGATISLAVLAVLFAAWFLFRRLRAPTAESPNTVVTWTVAVVFVVLLFNIVRQMDFSRVYRAFDPLLKNQTQDESVRSRLLAHDAAETMLADHWQRGVGAGGFRHLYPEYVKRHQIIYQQGHFFWEHAHNDWLEIPIELGAWGSTLLLLGTGYWLRVFIQHRALWHSLAVPVLLGCGQTLIHAWFDFPFQCPAILITWTSLIVISARWIEIESSS